MGAHLEKASLASAHLDGAILTSLKWADPTAIPGVASPLIREGFVEEGFVAASLEGADLTSAHLEGAALAGARANEGTRWLSRLTTSGPPAPR